MAARVAPLLTRLELQPNHRLLEIGCGNGTAVAAVAERLTTGHLLAIDRAGAPVTRATARNADHIARGVVEIVQVDLAALAVPARSFDTVFAVNVNLFQTSDPAPVAFIRRVLRRRGRLVLGYERWDGRQLRARLEQTGERLREGGLTVRPVEFDSPTLAFLTATP
jgi:protein-L-isoaspartate O-methyltransferase